MKVWRFWVKEPDHSEKKKNSQKVLPLSQHASHVQTHSETHSRTHSKTYSRGHGKTRVKTYVCHTCSRELTLLLQLLYTPTEQSSNPNNAAPDRHLA